jgi:hypothetical protein
VSLEHVSFKTPPCLLMSRAKELSFVLADFICDITACSAKALIVIVTKLLLKGSLNWIITLIYILDEI